ncbi:MAG: ribosome-associated translation inhibitor RaiA [Planctomycetota bacterium]|nr:MAG: ribosome-associated translation inhibitor RaiA [Planctomycetota bacterium]
MRINVTGRQMEITPAIERHVQQKGERLAAKYDDFVQQMDFTFSQEVASKSFFKGELLVAVRAHPEFVAKAEGHDVYALIDEVIHKAERQLHDHKEKQKLENR